MVRIRLGLIVVASSTLLLWKDAFAYIDPGTGSLMIQWLFGAVVAGFAVANIYWERAKVFLVRNFGSSNQGEDLNDRVDEAGRD